MSKSIKEEKNKKKVKKKSKQEFHASIPNPSLPKVAPGDNKWVMLGVRMTKEERERIKLYAMSRQTSAAALIREYIHSLPILGIEPQKPS